MPEKKIIIDNDDEDLGQGKKEAGKFIRVIAFSLGEENYCFDIRQAKEVIKTAQLTKVPNTPVFIIGIMNLRGEIISVVDIRYFFGLTEKEKTLEQRVIISGAGSSIIGILADKVLNTMEIKEDEIQPPLATLKSEVAFYTIGQVKAGDDIFILLDLEKILKCSQIEGLRKGGI